MPTPNPVEIKLHQKSQLVEISYADGKIFRLPAEFLRVYSPSAEVRGHGRKHALRECLGSWCAEDLGATAVAAQIGHARLEHGEGVTQFLARRQSVTGREPRSVSA